MASAGPCTVAVYNGGDLTDSSGIGTLLTGSGCSVVAIDTGTLDTPGALNAFKAVVVSPVAGGPGDPLDPAAVANIVAYVGTEYDLPRGTAFAFPNNWFDVLDTAEVVPNPSDPGAYIQDANISQIVLNAILVAAASGHGFVGEYTGGAEALTTNGGVYFDPSLYLGLGLITGNAGPLGDDANGLSLEEVNGSGIGIGDFTPVETDEYVRSLITGVSPGDVVYEYSDGEPAVLANNTTAPEPGSLSLLLLAAGLLGLTGIVRRRKRLLSQARLRQAVLWTSALLLTLSLGAAGLQAADTIFPVAVTPDVLSTGENLPMELGVKFQPVYNGVISGIRFYKGSTANSGPHVGSLWLYTGSRLPNTQKPGVNQPTWLETGILLGQVTFTSETATGWQEADFATPIPVTAQTVYVASYFTASGNPSVTGWWFGHETPFFTTNYTNAAGDLTALRDSTAGVNGVYAYAGSPGYPASPNYEDLDSWGYPNFWVDVAYTPNPIPESTIWPSTATPATLDSGKAQATEVGVRFRLRTTTGGSILGLRFYKAAANTGTHVGSLWSNTGTLMGQVTYSNETASGWQQANFPTPIPVMPNTTYVASYNTSVGHYSDNANYFASAGYINGSTAQLTALANLPGTAESAGGGYDGCMVPASVPTFPGNSNGSAANYWVDVVFAPASAVLTPPGGMSVNPSSVALGEVPVGGAAATATLTLKNTGTISMTITSATVNGTGFSLGAPNAFIEGPVGYGVPANLTLPLVVDAESTVTFPLSFSAAALGSQSGSVAFLFQKGTVASEITVPLSAIGVANTTLTPNPLALVFDQVAPGNSEQETIQLTASGGDVTLNTATISGSGFSLVSPPALPVLVTPSGLSLTVQFAPAAAGAATGNLQLATTACCAALNIPLSNLGGTESGGAGYVTIFEPSLDPDSISEDSQPTEVGMRFRASVGGTLAGIRFYKASTNTGVHVGSLWSNSGALLAQATFTNETAAGWQQVMFATPVTLTPGVTYVASYNTPTGNYALWPDFFTDLGYTNLTGTLTAINDGLDGINGVMLHTSVPAFPTGEQGVDPVYYPTGQSTNMLVDVVFNPDSIAPYTPLPPILQNLFPQGPDDQINTHLSVWATRGSTALSRAGSSATAWTTAAEAAHLWMDRSPNGSSTSSLESDAQKSYLLAWHQADEPDGGIVDNNYTSVLNSLTTKYNTWTTDSAAVGHPVHVALNFAAGFLPGLAGGCNMTCYHALQAAGDWIQSDVYPVTGFGRPDRLDWVGKSEDRKWQLSGKPHWGYIEASNQYLPYCVGCGVASRDQFRAEWWDGILHGSRGIYLFPELIGTPPPFEYDNMPPSSYDPADAGDNLIAEYAIHNATTTALASILQGQIDPPSVRASVPAPLEVAWRIDASNNMYFFVLNLSPNPSNGQQIVLNGIGNATSATVYGESRTIPITGATITDNFGTYGFHIYVVPLM
jgi:hypothetical protein